MELPTYTIDIGLVVLATIFLCISFVNVPNKYMTLFNILFVSIVIILLITQRHVPALAFAIVLVSWNFKANSALVDNFQPYDGFLAVNNLDNKKEDPHDVNNDDKDSDSGSDSDADNHDKTSTNKNTDNDLEVSKMTDELIMNEIQGYSSNPYASANFGML